MGVVGNRKADSLATVTDRFQSKYFPNKISFSYLTLYRQKIVLSARNTKWTSHASSSKWYKSIVSEIPRISRFSNSNLFRFFIISFSRFGHNRLSAYVFHLGLNSSSLRPRYATINIGDFHNFLFHCPNLSLSSINFFISFQ